MEENNETVVFTFAPSDFDEISQVLRAAFDLRTLNNGSADQDPLANLIAEFIEALDEADVIVCEEEE